VPQYSIHIAPPPLPGSVSALQSAQFFAADGERPEERNRTGRDGLGDEFVEICHGEADGLQCPSDIAYVDPQTIAGTGHYAVANARRSSYWFPAIDRLEDLNVMYDQDGSPNRAMFGINGACRLTDIKDGTSNTNMLVETPFKKNYVGYGPYWNTWNYTSGVEFGQIPNNKVAPCGAGIKVCPYAWGSGSAHPGGFHATKADGSVIFISDNTAFSIIQALVTINTADNSAL
jgi:hypothetical protein